MSIRAAVVAQPSPWVQEHVMAGTNATISNKAFGVTIDNPTWHDVMSALQTILGTILFFLFDLGIRNTFRMK